MQAKVEPRQIRHISRGALSFISMPISLKLGVCPVEMVNQYGM